MTTQRIPAAVDAFYAMISARATAKNRGQVTGRRNDPGTGTLKLRRPIMNALIEYCESAGITHVHMLSGTDIDLIVANRLAAIKPMRGEDVPRTTINNQVTGMKSFLSYCQKKRWITQDKWNELAANLTELPDTESPALIVPVEMWPLMFRFAGERHIVERIYLELGYYLLLRDSEVTRLQWKHINTKTRTIKAYRDKGGDALEFDIPDELWESLCEVRAWMEQHYGTVQPDWYLVPARIHIGKQVKRAMNPEWPVDPAKRTCASTSYGLIKKTLKAMGYTEDDLFGQASHVMRRSGAAHLFDANPHNINLIRAALGHKSIATTMRYIRRSLQRDELKAALNRPVKSRAVVPHQTGKVRVDPVDAQATLEAILDELTPKEQAALMARLAAKRKPQMQLP